MEMISARILLIFENGKISKESLHYSIEYARRMKGALSILILCDNIQGKEIEDTKSKLQEILTMMKQNGVQAKGEIKKGDKSSEFLKYLALEPSFSTIIWGSHENAVSDLSKKGKNHWFVRVTSNLECPVITLKARKGVTQEKGL